MFRLYTWRQAYRVCQQKGLHLWQANDWNNRYYVQVFHQRQPYDYAYIMFMGLTRNKWVSHYPRGERGDVTYISAVECEIIRA